MDSVEDRSMILLFPTFLLGTLLCYLIMRRDRNYWKREAEDQRLNNDLLCELHRDALEKEINLESFIEDLQLTHAEHLARCQVITDDTPIFEGDEIEVQ